MPCHSACGEGALGASARDDEGDDKVADEAENTRRFEAKQSQAQKRREDRARREAQATKPAAAPLP